MGQGLLFAEVEEDGVGIANEAAESVETNRSAATSKAREIQRPATPPTLPAGKNLPKPTRKMAAQSFDISHGGTIATLKFWLEKATDGIWIRGLPSQSCPSAGPYFDREEAEEDLAGMRRFYEEHPRYAF